MSEFKDKLKGYFVTGARPTEQQFRDLIDRGLYLDENDNLGVGTDAPSVKLEVEGNIKTHGIELSQDIRYNGLPVMGVLESSLNTPGFPIRAKRLSGTIRRGNKSISIKHGISSFQQKIIGVIPYSIKPEVRGGGGSVKIGSLIIRSDRSLFRIRELTVNSEFVLIDLAQRINSNVFGDVPVVVLILYIDQ